MDRLINFKIKNVDDVYSAVGRIIQAAQAWEEDYRTFVKLVGVEMEKKDIATLRRVNNTLYENGKITEKEKNDLNRVIHMRNYINHEFFLQDFHKSYEWIEEELSEILHYIFEANDVVANMIDKFMGNGALRPTVFDKEKSK